MAKRIRGNATNVNVHKDAVRHIDIFVTNQPATPKEMAQLKRQVKRARITGDPVITALDVRTIRVDL